jgi:hypothetical protein
MCECVNLQLRFGKRYRIGFDPVFDPHGKHRDRIDPWLYVIPCQRGTIYPHGGSLLAVEVDGRAITRQRLRGLGCTTVIQDGDESVAVTFDVADIDQIAEIVKPRRKRRLSEEQRRQAAERLAPYQFNPRSTDHSQRPKTHSEVAT